MEAPELVQEYKNNPTFEEPKEAPYLNQEYDSNSSLNSYYGIYNPGPSLVLIPVRLTTEIWKITYFLMKVSLKSLTEIMRKRKTII